MADTLVYIITTRDGMVDSTTDLNEWKQDVGFDKGTLVMTAIENTRNQWVVYEVDDPDYIIFRIKEVRAELID